MTSVGRGRVDSGPVLIVGPVTWDHFDERRTPGGAVTYAACVATAFGVRAHILVSAGDDANLDALTGHEVRIVRGAHTLTYEHQFFGRRRELSVVATPGTTLSAADVPSSWPPPATLVLAPLLSDDIDMEPWLKDASIKEIVLSAQGIQRSIDENDSIQMLTKPSERLNTAVNARVSVFLSGDEVAAWPAGALEGLAGRARRVVITRGREGADVYTAAGIEHIPARPAQRVDPTGAGDVFATAFILAVRAGEQRAGAIASAYAAAAVERRGPTPLPPLQEIVASLDQSGAQQR